MYHVLYRVHHIIDYRATEVYIQLNGDLFSILSKFLSELLAGKYVFISQVDYKIIFRILNIYEN